MEYLFLISIIILIIYLNNKTNNTMAKSFEEFQNLFSRQSESIENIKTDIEEIKAKIAESGLTSEQEDALFELLSGVTTKLEVLDAENPVVIPEPNPEEPVQEI